MYYVLTIKSVISSKILIRNNRVFSCLDSLLALYRLIGKKSLSLTFTSKIRILTRRYIFIFYFIFYLFIYLFIYFFASCIVDCVSCRKIDPVALFKYSKSFILFSIRQTCVLGHLSLFFFTEVY